MAIRATLYLLVAILAVVAVEHACAAALKSPRRLHMRKLSQDNSTQSSKLTPNYELCAKEKCRWVPSGSFSEGDTCAYDDESTQCCDPDRDTELSDGTPAYWCNLQDTSEANYTGCADHGATSSTYCCSYVACEPA